MKRKQNKSKYVKGKINARNHPGVLKPGKPKPSKRINKNNKEG